MAHVFVGVQGSGDSAHVAVFHGLPASFVGVELYHLDRSTDLALSDLTPAARSRVNQGITATGETDASRILAALRGQRLPVCVPSGTDATATPSTGPAPSGAAPTGAAPSGALPTDVLPPAATGSGATGPSASGTTATETTASSSAKPGVDCREAK
jgi:protein phosphatase